jgi:hypothetical protein
MIFEAKFVQTYPARTGVTWSVYWSDQYSHYYGVTPTRLTPSPGFETLEALFAALDS